jgi:hypothetical protein
MAPVPGWGPQILKQALRDLRYTAFLAQGSHDEHVEFEIRRGADWIGRLTVEHRVVTEPKERHDLRMVFDGVDKDHQEVFTAHSIKQMQEFAPVLAGRVCKYGMSRNRKWCDDCSQAERHKEGLFDPPRGPQLDSP